MNVLIVNNIVTALRVAASYDGAFQEEDLALSPEEILNDMQSHINNMRSSNFYTHINGAKTLIKWISAPYLDVANFPKIPCTESELFLEDLHYSLSKKWSDLFDNILDKNKPENVIIALLPSLSSTILKYLITQKYNTDISFTTFDSLRTEDIRRAIKSAAFNKEEIKTNYQFARAKRYLTDLVKVNITSQLYKESGALNFVDQYVLTTLFLLKNRSDNKGQPRFRINIKVNYEDDTTYTAESENVFTKESAAAAINTLQGRQISIGNTIANQLPTTATLFTMYNDTEYVEKEMKRLSLALFTKGFITCPYTLNGHLSHAYTNRQSIEAIKHICESFDSTLKNINDVKAMEALNQHENIFNKRRVKYAPSCIIPLKSCQDAGNGLNDREKKLYTNIATEFSKVFQAPSLPKKRLHVDDSYITFQVDAHIANIKIENCTCTFEMVEAGTFNEYTISELLTELVNYGIGNGETIMSIVDKLLALNFCRIAGNHIDISTEGLEYCSNYTLSAFTSPEQCIAWERSLSPTRYDTDINALIQSRKKEIAEWFNLAHEKLIQQQDTREDSDRIPKSDITKDVPSDKPVKIPDQLTIDGTVFKFNDLARTSIHNGEYVLRFGFDKDIQKPISAKYFYLKNNILVNTEYAAERCPYCGGKLHVNVWGLACDSCEYWIPFYLYRKSLDSNSINALICGQKTSKIEDFIDPETGAFFSACIQIDQQGKLHLFTK